MSSPFLEPILRHLNSEPSRTWSLVITFYGDAILPRGGSVGLQTLAEVLGGMGVNDAAVRAAVSRLAADGWLERRRLGRNSFYRLAEKGAGTFAEAARRIYGPHAAGVEDDRLRLLLLPPEMAREPAREALRAAGYGAALPDLWLAPWDRTVPAEARTAIALEARAGTAEARRLAALAWDLEGIAAGYRRFLEPFGEVSGRMPEAGLPGLESLVARLLLIHEYRRVVLRDPFLPHGMLPADWPGGEARRACADLYARLLPASEAWLDAHAADEDGPLPAPGAELWRRFRDDM